MSSKQTYRAIGQVIGLMPTINEMAFALWGRGCDVDSDGDAHMPYREVGKNLRSL